MQKTISSWKEHNEETLSLLPNPKDFIECAKELRSFQTREVLEAIISGERRRIADEQALWRIGGAVLGVCLGLGDGFQPRDIFLGLGFSSVAGMAHASMSQEDIKFLQSCQSHWLVGNNSPIELAQRVGPAKSRIILNDPSVSSPIIFNHHIGHRGEHLVPLFTAGDMAAGFSSTKSLEVLARHMSTTDINILRSQIYPNTNGAMKISALNQIAHQDAKSIPAFSLEFLQGTQPVIISTSDHGNIAGYEIPIPAHSDF